MFQIIQVIELGNHCANDANHANTPCCVVMDQNNLIGKYSMQFFLTRFEGVGIEGKDCKALCGKLLFGIYGYKNKNVFAW